MRHIARTFIAAFGLVAATAAAPAHGASPVVVELFTSQGCSSCPPADAVLAELARRPDVIALAWHVDYWNRLGWKDPYAGKDSTERQRAYRVALKLPNLYTPQMIVQGARDVVGSEAAQVARAVDEARSGELLPLQARWQRDGTIAIDLPAANATGTVRMIVFDRAEPNDVTAGENAGRRLGTTHPVASSRSLANWQGEATTVDARPALTPASEGVVVLLQNDELRVLGAAMLPVSVASFGGAAAVRRTLPPPPPPLVDGLLGRHN